MHLIVAVILLFAQHEHHMIASSDVGEVRFPSSCAPDAAKSVQSGVALLHSFWYDEAEKTFQQAIAQDKQCALAYWGVAMTQYHPLWPQPVTPQSLQKASDALATARALQNVPPRERAYVDALSTFYGQPAGTSVHDRALAYEAAMAKLVATYPDDDEAAIFYALSLNGSALLTDKTYAKQKQAAAILNRLLHGHPKHPGIIHYLIHSYDTPQLAPLALDAARSYANIAPSVPHALHMPSHIFTRLGLWNESIESNLRSRDAAKAHGDTGEQLHAMDYLEYAYLQLGRFDDAKRIVDELQAATETAPIELKTTYAIAAIPASFALERHDWRAASELNGGAKIDWNKTPRTASLVEFTRGIGAARMGNIDRAKQSEQVLTAFVSSEKDPMWLALLTSQQKSVAAWRLFAEGKRDDALAMMRAAADDEDRTEKPAVTPGALLPARELLGDMLLEMNQRNAAAGEYKAVLAVAPNRRNAREGLTRASTQD